MICTEYYKINEKALFVMPLWLGEIVIKVSKLTSHAVEIVDYNPQWAEIFSAEREALLAVAKGHFIEFEHIGSTAIPGQRANYICKGLRLHQSTE